MSLWILTQFVLLAGGVLGQTQMGKAMAVEIGVTDLLETAQCLVGYRLDSGEEHVLGWCWRGFDPESGVYFVLEQQQDLTNQLFMHCPWKRGPGVAYADFPLKLPQTSRITLQVAIAMRRAARKTDGVTYRVAVDGQLLWEQHCTWQQWRQFDIDLSKFAGRRVVLRIEVDPGPERKTTED